MSVTLPPITAELYNLSSPSQVVQSPQTRPLPLAISADDISFQMSDYPTQSKRFTFATSGDTSPLPRESAIIRGVGPEKHSIIPDNPRSSISKVAQFFKRFVCCKDERELPANIANLKVVPPKTPKQRAKTPKH
jgi:hypothetical protein